MSAIRLRPALALALAPLLALLAGCGGSSGAADAPAITANRVLGYQPVNSLSAKEADWPYFFHPDAALGLPGGTLDVVSLGYDPAAKPPALGGSLTLGLGPAGDPAQHACIVDGTGPDFAVFENAFRTVDPVDGPGTENEVAIVAVSADFMTWYAFPASIDSSKPAVDPTRYHDFAGVLPTAEGGDTFDLWELIAANPGVLDANFRACYMRLTDGGMLYPDYGNTQTDLWASGADIDAVVATHAVSAPSLAP
jgi:hypothetical protein